MSESESTTPEPVTPPELTVTEKEADKNAARDEAIAQIITSTAGLVPAGILGYAKGIAVTIGAVLTVLAQVFGDSWQYTEWLQLGILVCTIIATVAIPNPVKPVTVVQGPAT